MDKSKKEHLNKVLSGDESMNQGTNNVNNINLPNTIKYPKGGQINSSQQNENHPQTKENNSNTNPNPQPTTPDDESKVKKKVSGKLLVFLIVIVICYEYYTYVFWLKPMVLPEQSNFNFRLAILIVYHFLLFMMVWSFLITMKTIPGVIPLYWGFYIGDEEYKRKRYCLICNAFKPERSHHCSVCQICVLNMDHHCPWVNNCIGFYNRKFFMQLLFYLFVLLYFVVLTCAYDFYEIVLHIYTSKLHLDDSTLLKYLIIIPAYLLVLVLTFLNTMFFKFHMTLVLNNSTTIESLDSENKENDKFKLGYSENWSQVFGFDKLLWFFPIFAESGRPNGDGLNWKLNSAFEMNLNSSQMGKDSHSGIPNNNNKTNQSVSQYATNNVRNSFNKA